jgi:sterol desaturase/sphingolipid hydroxylase (fatty acid hydroxylase superfamily)
MRRVIDLGQLLLDSFDRLMSPVACRTYAGLVIFLGAMLVIDAWRGRGLRYDRIPGFKTDLLYMLLTVGGIYGLIEQPVLDWIASLVSRHASFLYLGVLRHLAEPVQLIAFLAAVDFCRYWKHRLMHATPYLWAFHCIHHAPERLNFLINYRIHLLEALLDGVVTLLPVILLGVPAEIWLPVYLLLIWYTSLHHCDLDLNFGWLERVLVSPRFHSTHHSANRLDYNRNFGVAFSIWDVLFGTAHFAESRPQTYGLSDRGVPCSFAGQLLFPIKSLARRVRRSSSDENAVPASTGAGLD